MLTEKDFCDNQTSDELENLGYPRYHYDATEIDKIFRIIPLYAAQKWLREERRIEANAFYDNMDATWRFYILEIDSPDLSGTYAYNYAYMSYEEALSEGIKEAIKILTNNENE